MTQEQVETITFENALAIKELTVIAKRTSDDVDKVIKHMETTQDQEDRIKRVEESLAKGNIRFEKLNVIFMMLRYPKWTLLSILGLYAFAYKDVREPILGLFKIVG